MVDDGARSRDEKEARGLLLVTGVFCELINVLLESHKTSLES